MAGLPGTAARRYHELTKHTPESVRASRWRLDPRTRPQPFKDYPGLEPLPLPADLPGHGLPALEALAGRGNVPKDPLTLPELARLLRLGAGVLRTRRLSADEVYHFRTYSSAGGLYPLELYLACADLPGLDAGLHHFHPLELSLRRLRAGDVRGVLAQAADAPELGRAGAVLVVTGILWRSAWKYGLRAYRHLYWDAGTMLGNLLALASSAGLDAQLRVGFVDAEVSRLLGVDGVEEAPVALLAVGDAPAGRASAPAGEAGPAGVAARAPRSFPEAIELHRASALGTAEEVRAWRRAAAPAPAADEAPDAAASPTAERLSVDPLEAVIRRRGSARALSLESIGAAELQAILLGAAGRIPADVGPVTEIRLIVNAVDGLRPGAYRLADGRLELLGAGDFRRVAGFLCLEQALGARAAATNFLVADLPAVLERLGDRGYRAAQLEGGLRAARIYLAAYAQCLGATGLTFYDDEVTTFLAPGLSPMLTVAIGVDPRRDDLRRCRESLAQLRGARAAQRPR